MFIEAFLALSLLHANACPTAFNQTNTTVSGITNSSELTLCVSNSYLVRGSNGSLTLVLNSGQSAPKCLIYPNGLPSDLAYQLLASGHTGCWSLYPPSEPIVIVNIGKPSQASITQALRTFRPLQPRIIVAPSNSVLVGTTLKLSNTAKVEIQKGTMLNLPCEVRFRPIGYKWIFANKSFSGSTVNFVGQSAANYLASLTVSYSVEYRFPSLVSWRAVKPDIQASAIPLAVSILSKNPTRHRPKLVDQPCFSPNRWGC